MRDIPLIDVEASGLHVQSFPIEIAVWVRGRMHAWLIRPEPEWTYWDEAAETVHHITREQLLRDGKPVHVVATELNAACGSTTLYSDAAAWDLDWVDKLYDATLVPREPSVRGIESVFSWAELDKFQSKLRQLQHMHEKRRHRAAVDVELMLRAYRFAVAE